MKNTVQNTSRRHKPECNHKSHFCRTPDISNEILSI